MSRPLPSPALQTHHTARRPLYPAPTPLSPTPPRRQPGPTVCVWGGAEIVNLTLIFKRAPQSFPSSPQVCFFETVLAPAGKFRPRFALALNQSIGALSLKRLALVDASSRKLNIAQHERWFQIVLGGGGEVRYGVHRFNININYHRGVSISKS